MSYYNLQTIIDHIPDFDDHILTEAEVGQHLSAYKLHIPDEGYIQSVMIVDTPYGLCILGDWTPNNNKGAIALGYHLNWFAEQLSPHRLQDVFGLEESWQPDLAAEYCRDWLERQATRLKEDFGDDMDPAAQSAAEWINKELQKTNNRLSWSLENRDEADEYYEGANVFFKKEDPAYEHICGYGPSLRDVALLWAIQKKFSETYSKLLQTKKETL